MPSPPHLSGEPAGRSPFIVHDPAFAKLIIPFESLDLIWTGGRWTEGPAYFPAMHSLVWSDIPNNRMMRYDELSDSTGVFRTPSGNSNGNTIDRQGRLITCEHRNRRITRTEIDGAITIVADRYRGKRFNSPNDVVVQSDGTIWFTDPDYGIQSEYDGSRAIGEIGSNNVYRIVPGGEPELMIGDIAMPNGLAFSPDETMLYVADSSTGGAGGRNGPPHIRKFDFDGERLSGGTEFATLRNGWGFDGFRVDEGGRIWTSAGAGVDCYASDGALLGRIAVPEFVANVVFGGPSRNRLYICATTSVYAVWLNTYGARTF